MIHSIDKSIDAIERLQRQGREFNAHIYNGYRDLMTAVYRHLLDPHWLPEYTGQPERDWIPRAMSHLQQHPMFEEILKSVQGDHMNSVIAAQHISESLLTFQKENRPAIQEDIEKLKSRLDLACRMGMSIQRAKLDEQIQQVRRLYDEIASEPRWLRLDHCKQALDPYSPGGAMEDKDELISAVGAVDENSRFELLNTSYKAPLEEVLQCLGHLEGRVKIPSLSRQVQTFDVDYGNDLSNIFPEHWGEDEDLFNLQYAEESLMQSHQGTSSVSGNGDFIALIDMSGSMVHSFDRWHYTFDRDLAGLHPELHIVAKAFALKCGEVVRQNNRECYLGGFTALVFDDHIVGKEPEKTTRFLQRQPKGKESWMGALDFSMKHIREHGKFDSDVLLITDGHSHVDAVWFSNYLKAKEEFQFKVFAIAIGDNCTLGSIYHKDLLKIADYVVILRTWDDFKDTQKILEELNK